MKNVVTMLSVKERSKTMSDNNPRNENSNACRRSLLKSMAALAGIAVLPTSKKAFAQKAPQAAVQYQDKPKGDQQCDNCVHWEPPGSCKVVEGSISPKGWCAIWAKKP
jgi:hypothetical protein